MGAATPTKIARAPHPTPLRGATLPARGRDSRPCEVFRRNSYDTGRTGPFCKAEFIAAEMDKRFAAINGENNLRGLDAATFAARAAEHIGELNAIHPFLDGNGRALRAFLENLAEQAGHHIDLARVDPQAWNVSGVVLTPSIWRWDRRV